MTTFKFGPLTIDAAAYGSQGSAFLGIRDSGKTYSATSMAEKLYDVGIPFITFDPTGVWQFMRVPGKGAGYPIVVAGGKHPDLPLTTASAPKIVEAAIQNGVSLVIDLTDPDLSKADWRRIVTECVRVLMQKNAEHGLRHIFIEEAAEFVPQKILDGVVYAQLEKLVRIGGNHRLGVTLINQRAQEVNKAVLELCENIFLHRQKGKNALKSIRDWLEVAEVEASEDIISSLSKLPTGQCWAWLAGDDNARLIKVPPKRSFHPDRRAMRGDAAALTVPRVDVGTFVEGLKSALPKIEAEAAANDPKALRAEIARLKKQMADGVAVGIVPAEVTRIRSEAYNAGWAAALKEGKKAHQVTIRGFDRLRDALTKIGGMAAAAIEQIPVSPPEPVAAPTPSVPPPTFTPSVKATIATPIGAKPTGSAAERIRQALAWWHAQGHDAPTRVQVAFLARYSPRSSGYEKQLSNLSSAGEISFPGPGCVALVDRGSVPAPDFGSAIEAVRAVLDPRMWRVLEPLLDGKTLTREELAAASNYSDRSSGYEKTLSQMRGLSVIDFPGPGQVRLADWLMEA